MSFKTKVSPKLVSLAFGVLVICFVIGFYIFAWTPPSQSPPQDNVPLPLNVSANSQTKLGNLILNTSTEPAEDGLIIMQGYLQIYDYDIYGGGGGPPDSADCDADTKRGRMIWDYENDRLYICDGVDGWKYKTFDNL